MLPLQGYPLLERTPVHFGRFASQLLADHGADLNVIRIKPLKGDALSSIGFARVLDTWRRPYRASDGSVLWGAL